MRTFGVEEELLLVDANTGRPRPLAPEILAQSGERELRGFALTSEVAQEMVEVVVEPCRTADELRGSVRAGRETADGLARELDARAVALATSPVPQRTHLSVGPRYAAVLERFRGMAQGTLECGLHVHVSIDDAGEGVAVLDRIRVWLPVILALSANSPFRDGSDTGFASYRHVVWHLWPTAGPLEVLGSPERYEQLVQSLLATGGILDDGQIYFDARLSRRHPTVEVRVADVCLDPEDTITLAVLIRALVDTAVAEWRRGEEPNPLPAQAIRLAAWMAARWGVRGDLVDPRTGRAAPAAEVVEALLAHVRPALAANGDTDTAETGVREILLRGTGAERQRARRELSGSLAGAALGTGAVDDERRG
ncbi:glutamate--cysteine ligase [Microbacterium oryzae]|uniref:carboxylate-amine ligase n=1 Tax=Microbacterium oryzae TaxID=743009 RepID=UPI0025B1E837|nr:glutamate--cysteine ligase [Microbacterium oryzae]MDN3311364.1 glutamate--cysteine ligase [Microbacterium oryzae]